MKKTLVLSSLLLASAFAAGAATLNTVKGALIFKENVDGVGEVKIEFANCMANDLYTFKSVSINGVILNATSSDNIGPFLITSGWVGGNHTNNNVKSAKTSSVKVMLDGKEINRAGVASYKDCKVLDVVVVNDLYLPGQEPKLFAKETMTYRVAGNSIDVTGKHEYKNEIAQKIDRYYGMQSMFFDETEILTPGGAYSRWTPVTEVDRFSKASAPDFCTFIEHSPNGYQASYMTREGIGDRHMVPSSDWVFIGNSSTKCYHKTIGSQSVKAGDETMWHGVYSWFTEPLADECRNASDSGTFAYKGWLDGKETEFRINPDGTMSTTTAGVEGVETSGDKVPFAWAGSGEITVSPAAPGAVVYSAAGIALHRGSGTFSCAPGIYIITDGAGASLKLLVR